jgi:hypothetical protein
LATVCNVWYGVRAWDYGEWTRPLSRVLVLLTALLLMVMPVTEHLCNWDRFLRGGPDVEFSILAWLLFAAMIVLSMHGTMLHPTVMHPEIIRSFVATTIPCDRGDAGFVSHRILNSHPLAGPVWRRHLTEARGASELCLAVAMRI